MISKFLLIFLFSGLVCTGVPDPPIDYLMEGEFDWRVNDPNGIPGKAILYYDLPPHFDGIPDLVVAFNIYSVSRKPCLKKNLMTDKYIILNTGCGTRNSMVYVLERPNFAMREFRICELRKLCLGWLFTKKESNE